MKVKEVLQSLNAYPVPRSYINYILERGGYTEESEMQEAEGSRSFILCKALFYGYLSTAPNLSQGGQNYSFSEEQRAKFSLMSKKLMQEAGESEEANANGIVYGYKGSKL